MPFSSRVVKKLRWHMWWVSREGYRVFQKEWAKGRFRQSEIRGVLGIVGYGVFLFIRDCRVGKQSGLWGVLGRVGYGVFLFIRDHGVGKQSGLWGVLGRVDYGVFQVKWTIGCFKQSGLRGCQIIDYQVEHESTSVDDFCYSDIV